MLRTPRAFETHATLAPEGDAVSSVGKAALRTWSSVKEGCCACAHVIAAAMAARSFMLLLYRLDFRLLALRIHVRRDQALAAVAADGLHTEFHVIHRDILQRELR